MRPWEKHPGKALTLPYPFGGHNWEATMLFSLHHHFRPSTSETAGPNLLPHSSFPFSLFLNWSSPRAFLFFSKLCMTLFLSLYYFIGIDIPHYTNAELQYLCTPLFIHFHSLSSSVAILSPFHRKKTNPPPLAENTTAASSFGRSFSSRAVLPVQGRFSWFYFELEENRKK